MAASFRTPRVSERPVAAQLLPSEWGVENPEFLSAALGTSGAAEFRDLCKERTPELFFSGLIALGRRLEAAGKTNSAFKVYSLIAEIPKTTQGSGAAAALDGSQRQAEQRIAALQGRAAGGELVESLLGGFVKQAADYRLILPMMAGTAAFQLTKQAVWARLLQSPTANFLTRGAAAETVAGIGAFGAEISVFAGLNRALRPAQGHVDTTLSHDWITAALSLSTLKAAGFAGNRAAQAIAPLRGQGLAKLGAAAVPQVMAYLGLLAAARVEAHFGFRPKSDLSESALQTLGSLIAMQVGASLGERALGPGWRRFQNDIQSRAGALPAPAVKWAEVESLQPAMIGPPVYFSIRTPVDRFIRTLKPAGSPVKSARAQEPGDPLQALYSEYPKLKKAVAHTNWRESQQLDLFNMVLETLERNPADRETVLKLLPSAIGTMTQVHWSYEQQYNFLKMLRDAGMDFGERVRNINLAIREARNFSACEIDVYNFVFDLCREAGPHADKLMANLKPAVKIFKHYGWNISLSKDALTNLTRSAGKQVGIALANFAPTFETIMERTASSTQMNLRMFGVMSKPAANEAALKRRLEIMIPKTLEALYDVLGEHDDNFHMVYRILDVGAPQSDATLQHFSKAVQALKEMGFERGDIVEYVNSAIGLAPHSLASVIHWTAYVAAALRQSGILHADVLDVLFTFAAQAKTVSEASVATFVSTLTKENRDIRESDLN